MSELKPCPFCGSVVLAAAGLYSIHCQQCGAEGPDADTHDRDAVHAAWNRRLAPAQDAEQEIAGDVREPKNGNGWKIVWWNESMRMMLPDHRHLDYFQSYNNGTMTMTVKEIDAARAEKGND